MNQQYRNLSLYIFLASWGFLHFSSLRAAQLCFKHFSSPVSQQFSQLGVPFINTLGPASLGKELEMVQAGTRIFRVNTSHIMDPVLVFESVRDLDSKLRHSPQSNAVGVLVDLPGLKMRLTLPLESKGQPLTLEPQQEVQWISEGLAAQYPNAFSMPNETFLRIKASLAVGSSILVDDGKIRFKVQDIEGDRIVLTLDSPSSAIVRNRKGINIPNIFIEDATFLPLDQQLLKASLLTGRVSHVALSFVQSAEDMRRVRDFMQSFYSEIHQDILVLEHSSHDHLSILQSKYQSFVGQNVTQSQGELLRVLKHALESPPPLLVAKIENEAGLKVVFSIAQSSDGLMVARGDLGTEIDAAKSIIARTMIESAAQEAGIFSIVATGVLTSVSNEAVPARSEAEGIAAIMRSRSALMTSEETAMGGTHLNPVDVIHFARRSVFYTSLAQMITEPELPSPDTIQSVMEKFGATSSYTLQDFPNEIFLTIPIQSRAHLRQLAQLPKGFRAIVICEDVYLLRQAQGYFGISLQL